MSNPPPYIEIPTYAVAIASEYALSESPKSGSISPPRTPPQQQPVSPNAAANTRFNLSSMLLNQALSSLPTPPPSSENKGPLLSTRDPLSIPIMSANFRRFIGKCGFVFWLQDRVEEVVMWKKGNVYTGAWIAVYVFLCKLGYMGQPINANLCLRLLPSPHLDAPSGRSPPYTIHNLSGSLS